MGYDMQRLAWAAIDAGAVSGMPNRMVLLTIADRAKDKGDLRGMCWPKVENIAARADCSKRTVLRAIDELEAAGLMKRRSHSLGDQRRGSLYALNLSKLEEIAQITSKVAPDTETEILAQVKQITGDMQSPVEDAHRCHTVTPQVTETTFTGDRNDSLYRKNQEENQEENQEPVASAPERVLVYDEDSTALPPRPVLVLKPKADRPASLSEDDTEQIRMAYPQREKGPQARKAIKAQHALLVAGKVRSTADGKFLPKMSYDEAVSLLVDKCRLWGKTEKARGEYCPLPATWFNGACYTEDPCAWGLKTEASAGPTLNEKIARRAQ